MVARGSLDVPGSATLNFWVNSVKVPLGKHLPRSSWIWLTWSFCFREVYKARAKRDDSIVALKKILMHNERDGVRLIWYSCFPPQLSDRKKFPITALREIKLLKMLSHVNIMRLREMAVERSKGTRYLVIPLARPV